jgi:type I restriction enzyme M protein
MQPTTQKIDAAFYQASHTQKDIMTSVENFKSAVIRIRDILRGPGVSITGMDSMRHICLYLLSRYMTRNKVSSLGVPDEFAWENLIDIAQTKNGGVQKALDYFYHKEEDSLVNHFDRLFGTEKFSFDVKNPQKHKEILEILNAVNMADVDCQMDILGWVYEQHLKTGSSAARDLGQFFTDRLICTYMVKLCSPKFKNKGVPESVCDPTMGTAGFLTGYIKYFKDTYPEKPIDWAVQQKEIHGCDTDPKVAGVARLNLFMESGGQRFENILTHDSLYGDLPLTGYDVILANMPFGLRGILHASCCERVKDLKIRGTKSEPLFLQLMMVSLKRGGRCAVVVPDGMLVNTSTLHNGTRKYLLDNLNLKRVIKMKGQFFMNTTIQPTILFFENTGKGTEAVEFWDVVADAKGTITETMILSVPRAKFDDACSLDLRRYQEIEKPVANPAGFPMVKLGDVCEYSNGKTLASSDKIEDGEYDVMGGGMEYIGKTSKYNREGETISISKSGASAGFVAYHNKKYWAGDCLTLITKDITRMTTRYLYYFMKLNSHLTMSKTSGSTIPHCKWDDIKNILITVPPLPIQQEIVATLDRIYAPGTTELSETLKMTDRAMDLVLANPGGATLEPIVEAQRLIRKSAQMVADVKAQMVAIMKSVGSRGFPTGKVGDNVSFMNGYAFKTEEFIDSGIPIVKIKNIKNNILSFEKVEYAKEDSKLSKYSVKNNDMVISLTGELSGDVGLNTTGQNWYLNQRVARIDIINKELNPKYLYYYMVYSGFVESVRNLSTGSAQPNVSTKSIENLTMPLPPHNFQEKVLSYLNDLQTQLTSLENLQKQSERNAKFILDSYLNAT